MSNENVVADNKVVSLAYTLWVDDEIVDSADGQDPLVYLQGHENIIPGLEKAIAGMAVGDKKIVVVDPVEGYGEYVEESTISLERSMFPEDYELVVGDALNLQDDESEQVFTAFVVAFDDESVQVDMNHPLAGKSLRFEVEVVALRDALPAEIGLGHVAPAGGCSSCSGCASGSCC